MEKREQLEEQWDVLGYLALCKETKRQLWGLMNMDIISVELYNKTVNPMYRDWNKKANAYYNKYRRSVHANLDNEITDE